MLSAAAWGQGGIVLLGGDDLNDHGSRTSAGVNLTGWKYIENGIKSMIPQVKRTGPFTVDIVALTVTPTTSLTGSSDGTAILSAATNLGLTVQYVNTAAEVNKFFTDLEAGTVNPKMLWIPGDGNSGGTDSSEEAALAANASKLNAYVGSGGGLFAHTGRYSWLAAVLPGSTIGGSCNSSTLSLTAVGQSVFPALTNADIRSGPCHNNFQGNIGGLQVLAADGGGNRIIIGGLTGSGGLTDPGEGGGNAGLHPISCFVGPVFTDVPVTGAITSTLPGPVLYTITRGNLGWGLRMHPDGTISGTPGNKGTYLYTVSATDATATVTHQQCALVVYGPQPVPTITSACPLNGSTVGTAFSQNLTATGGVGTLSYSIGDGSLPAGLTLSTSGLISGTPTADGTSNFTLQVTDTGTPVQTASKVCSMVTAAAPVAPTAPVITMSCPFAPGTVGVNYHLPLTATSSSAVVWRLVGGALPGGLVLQSGGGIVGTPHTAGTFTFTLTATNNVGSVTLSCSIVISPAGPVVVPAPTINNACPLSSATVGTAYSASFTSTNGVAPLTYTISAGALPAGLALSSVGTVSGTPTGAETASFTVLVTDSSTPTAQTGSKACSLVVVAAPPPASAPTISTSCPLPTGTELTHYSQVLAATGGTAPYTYSIASGLLPRPLTLSAGGAISGAPYHSGVYSFTLQVAGADGLTSQKSCTLTINPHTVSGGLSAGSSRGSIVYGEETGEGVVSVGFELSETLPFNVTGRAYLTARSKTGIDSEAIAFTTGGREVDFVIEAGQTKAKFTTDSLGIQLGDHSAELSLSIVLDGKGTLIPVDLSGTEMVRGRKDN
jgi:hypothetical protein